MKQANALGSGSLKQRLVDAMRLHTQGKLEAAQTSYEALLAEYPHQPDILNALATIHLQNKEPEKAMDALAKMLAINSDHEKALDLLYDLCLPESKTMQTSPIQRLVTASPNNVGVRSVAARLAQTAGDEPERLVHMDALYALGVRTESFYAAYALSLCKSGILERCLKLCQEGLGAYPDSVGILKVRANAYSLLGRYDASIKDWERVIAQQPKEPENMTKEDHAVHVALGIVKLLISDCREGYDDYAAHRDFAIVKESLVIPLPEWKGEALQGKRLLLWSSQGIGDVVMFASLLPWLLAQGGKVTLALYPKMIPIFMRSFPGVEIIPYSKNNLEVYASQCDVQAVFGQLMQYGLPHYTPAEHPPFLKADAARAKQLREKYLTLKPGTKKLVGISWHTINNDTAGMRNIPLAQWAPLFSLPHIQYISLQYGEHAAEIDAASRAFPNALHADSDIDAFVDIDGLAAQMRACDEIISVQNATVHLAGALGVRTTLMLNAASDWRWGLKHTDSHWYKSVTIERQETLLDWKPVLGRVRGKLETLPEEPMDKLATQLAFEPNNAEALDLLSEMCLPGTKPKDISGSAINQLIALYPDITALHRVAINLCRKVDERTQRLKHLEVIYQHGVSGVEFYNEYAAMLGYNGQYDRCVEICEKALQMYPDSASLYRVRAYMHEIKGEYEKALACHARVLELKPDDLRTRMSAGTITLLINDGKKGFEDLAAIRDNFFLQCNFTTPIPEWRGQPLSGKRLLLWSNQGVGDIVMFAGLLPWLLAQGGQVTLALYPKMIPLFARSFPGLSVIPFTPDKKETVAPFFASFENKCDYQLAMSQLMGLALPHYTPAEHRPHLKADETQAKQLREKYLRLRLGIKKLVGISWHTANQDTASQRNISLDQWSPLFSLPHIQYISLQYGDHAAEIEAMNRTFPGALFADPAIDAFADIDGLAAQMKACDEIVSVQNATVHLAGALGVRTALMLSAAADWRWGLGRTDSHWYKSIAIERQETLLNWPPVFARVREKLS